MRQASTTAGGGDPLSRVAFYPLAKLLPSDDRGVAAIDRAVGIHIGAEVQAAGVLAGTIAGNGGIGRINAAITVHISDEHP